MVMVVVGLPMVVVMMFVGAAAARGAHKLFYLQFFDPQFLAGYDGMTEAAAGGTGVEIGADGELPSAVVAGRLGRYTIDEESRPLQQSPPAAGVKAEFDGVGDHSGEIADLQDHHGDPPAGPMLETDVDDALGQGKFVQRGSTGAGKMVIAVSCCP